MLDDKVVLDRLRRGEFALTRHAVEQMEARRIGAESIEVCARHALEGRWQEDNQTYRVLGPFENSNKNLVVVCAWSDAKLVVVTAHLERRKWK